MIIHNFRFENKMSELEIKPIHFSSLSLLVGVSGVGKTLILQAISDLKRIAKGKSSDGVEWDIQFSVNGNKNYLWKGAFEKTGIAELPENDMYEDDESVMTSS